MCCTSDPGSLFLSLFSGGLQHPHCRDQRFPLGLSVRRFVPTIARELHHLPSRGIQALWLWNPKCTASAPRTVVLSTHLLATFRAPRGLRQHLKPVGSARVGYYEDADASSLREAVQRYAVGPFAGGGYFAFTSHVVEMCRRPRDVLWTVTVGARFSTFLAKVTHLVDMDASSLPSRALSTQQLSTQRVQSRPHPAGAEVDTRYYRQRVR